MQNHRITSDLFDKTTDIIQNVSVHTSCNVADIKAWTHIFENDVAHASVLGPVCQKLLQVTLVKTKQTNEGCWKHYETTLHSDTKHLYSGVNIVDVWDAAKNGLDFFLGQNGSTNLPLLL